MEKVFVKARVSKEWYYPNFCVLETCGLSLNVEINELNKKVYDDSLKLINYELLRYKLRDGNFLYVYIPIEIREAEPNWYNHIKFDFCDYEGSDMFVCRTEQIKAFRDDSSKEIKLPYQLKEENALFFKDFALSYPQTVKSKDGTNISLLKIKGQPKLNLLFLDSKIALTYDYVLKRWIEDNNFFLSL